ncbi:MAG: gliding motility protein GldM [Dysgonamonadaceae bacterium]|jgi:gliding motility-associated protein GldM|nr:gliding motility protein GldM [Dysgonamonadaceae bacterium]
MASNDPNSPRQKMINLMYLVFIAMLALNVSSEVLDGFELVEASLLRSVKASTQHNDRIFDDLATYHKSNPQKTQEWYDKGEQVKNNTDSLFNYIQYLKEKIVKKADGKNGDPEHLEHPDDLNAAYDVMFAKGKNDGAKLKTQIDEYREYVTSLVSNPEIKNIISSNLSTEVPEKSKLNNLKWEEAMFENMPMAAAVTILTKLQNDIRYAQGEVLGDLLKNVDLTDFRVNKIKAFVIPDAQIVMRGSEYRAHIGLVAQDSTQTPKIFVNNQWMDPSLNGQFAVRAASTGTFSVQGYIEMPRRDGSTLTENFSEQYFVVEPSATIAPVLMNVLYAGIDNDISIAAPGMVSQNVTATINNGSLTRKSNDIWVAKPSKIGEDAVITVVAKTADGRSLEMGKKSFRVRKLPDPMAYLSVPDANGNADKFTGGPLSKAALANVDVLKAAIDDGILNTAFTVLRFELVTTDGMGMTLTEISDGARFSERQKSLIRNLNRGKRAYIRGVMVKSPGPGGDERTLKTATEIIIN